MKQNRCIVIPLECFSYDRKTGVCYSCVPGYEINGGLCEKAKTSVYLFGRECVSCLPGFKMIDNKCVYSPKVGDLRSKNVLCFVWEGQSCKECMPGTYLSSRGVCELIDPFCLNFDYKSERCSRCESGYSNLEGRCVTN